MRIAVLGAGSWGTALSIILTGNSHYVTLWSHDNQYTDDILLKRENPSFLPGVAIPEEINATSNLDEAVDGCEMIVTATPSQFVRSVMVRLHHLPSDRLTIVNVAKGIEVGTLMTMSQVLHDTLPHVPPGSIATLSGPSHAEEVSRKVPTTVVAASTSLETAKLVQRTFMTPYFRVYASTDLKGVEIGGSLKNVIAIAAGIVDGADLGDNTKAALMTRGIAEITRIGVALGAHVQTFAGLSGIGDLMVTCMSRHSRNRYVGVEIGKGRKLRDVLAEMVMVAEGVETTKSANELAKKVGVEVPICAEVYKMLFEEKDPKQSTYDLMTRGAKGEVY
ncbi:MAG: NAD(P)H-dependent glycerol-3-phosphate dehydrogenase [Ignavibacteriae bacterium]|nr:NAD(P)H-dependent glycerol-3-phosphate dehydrogenase [Ignavibacteriota bacterium]